MKEYTLENYDHPNFVLKDLCEELQTFDIDDTTVNNKDYGEGYVEQFEISHAGNLITVVCYDNEVEFKSYDLELALSKGTIAFENEKLIKLLNDAFAGKALIQKLFDERSAIKAEELRKRYEIEQKIHAEKVRAAQEAKAKRDAEAKAFKRTQKMLQKLDYAKCEASRIKSGNDAIDFLKENVTSISAVMPDTLENWFIGTFGPEAEHKVVDHLKKTSNGYAMKFSLSIKAHLKSIDNMPAELSQYVSGKKEINNTAFLFKLVLDEGFKFGKQA